MALIDKKLTELTEILSVPDNAFIHVVDTNDVSQSPEGSSYKAKKSTIGGAVKAQVTVSGTVKTNVNNADPIVYLKGSVDALLADKQDTLVNGINIASINSQNLLNGGNIEIANTIPTLQQVLDNNHDLIDGNNFQGTDAGLNNLGSSVNALGGSSAFNNSGSSVNALGSGSAYENTGSSVNALGTGSAENNSGSQVNALGTLSAVFNTGEEVNALGTGSAENNSGSQVNALGIGSAQNNSGSQVNAFGSGSANNNTFSNVNLFGQSTTADENGQTVFGKTNTIFARLSTLLLTATRKYILPNQSGTIALESYVDTQIATNASLVVTNDATTNRVLSILDANTFIVFSGGNTDLTIPLNANVGFQIGTKIEAFINGVLSLNVLATSGVTIISPNGLIALNRSTLLLTKIAINTWYVNIIPKLFLIANGGLNYSAQLQNLTTNFIFAGSLQCAYLFGDGAGIIALRAIIGGGVNDRWESTVRLRLADGLTPINSQDLTPKAYVDAIPNPTLNVLPKKGASGFVDSAISEDATKIVLTKDVKSATVFDDTPTTGATRFLVKAGAADGLASPTFRVLNNSGTRSITIGLDANGFVFNFDNTHKIQGREITLSNNSLFGFSNSDVNGTRDIGFVRGSAGKLYIGNSEDGNFSGTLVTTKIGLGVIAPTESLDVLGSIKLSNLLKLGQFTTATEPAYVKGASFFNTTLNKMRIGGATSYETVTSS
jgi:hypothetical protein